MTADIIQANYEQLDNIANRFGNQAENNAALMQRVTQGVQALQGKGWEGQAAAAFFAEMDGTIFPTMQRLTAALEEARTVTFSLREVIRAAEEEAASLFEGEYVGIGAGPFGEALGFAGNEGQTASLNNASSLVGKNPNQVFNKDYMERFIGSRYQGGDTAELNQLMEDLMRADPANRTQVNAMLDRIADIRGVNRADFRAQYEKFLVLRANAGPVDPLDLNKYGNFLGSTTSLRYGKVVGDVLGLDPVFGSLLNPTGGIVGPGNGYYVPGDNDAIGYHGVFHDAAGYLYNHHNGLGPGYNYLGREPFPTGNPLTGQVGGISWWASHSQLDVDVLPNIMPDIPYVPEFIERGVGNLIESGPILAIRQNIYAVEGGIELIDDVSDVVVDVSSGLYNGAGDLSSQIFGWP